MHGLALWDVTRATVVAKLQHVLALLGEGFLKVDEINRLKSVVRKAQRYGYPDFFPDMDE